MGLDGQAKPLSGGYGRRGATSRKENKWVWFGIGGGHLEEEQEEEQQI
jgi:ribosomal protein L15